MRTDTDPTTHLPMDNLTYAGGASAPTTYGRYTSAANIGVYLWSLVSAQDLGLVTPGTAQQMARATLGTVSRMDRYDGFLYQWYDTTTGARIVNPTPGACDADRRPPPSTTATSCPTSTTAGTPRGSSSRRRRCRRAGRSRAAARPDGLQHLLRRPRPDGLQRRTTAFAGNQPSGQMYGGYYAGLPPTQGTTGSTTTTTARSTPTRGSAPTSAWARSRCPPTCGGAAGASCPRRSAPPTPTSRGRASGRWPAAGCSRRIPSPARSSRSGRGTTPTLARP